MKTLLTNLMLETYKIHLTILYIKRTLTVYLESITFKKIVRLINNYLTVIIQVQTKKLLNLLDMTLSI
jgi:hypothetical protein